MRLFFIHIPKCAGMTLHAIIEREYPPEAIYTVPSVSWNEQNFASLRDEWSPERKAKIRVVKGHMEYGWHQAFLDDDYEYITLLRHPVDRILSFYAHVGESHPAYSLKQQGLETFVSQCQEAQNHATFMLGGGRDFDAFRLAQRRLEKMMVGRVENFVNFVWQLRTRYGWSHQPYEVKNITSNRLRVIPEAIREMILGYNLYDWTLWMQSNIRSSHDLRRVEVAH